MPARLGPTPEGIQRGILNGEVNVFPSEFGWEPHTLTALLGDGCSTKTCTALHGATGVPCRVLGVFVGGGGRGANLVR